MKNTNEQKHIYTLGVWYVKSGKKTEFIHEWTAFARWTDENIPGAGRAYLLQDENDSLRFISFGPWDHENSIRKWRDSERFKNFIAGIKDLCDDFQPNTLKMVSSSNQIPDQLK
jgi:heme-degrading monooxygenase HmoA